MEVWNAYDFNRNILPYLLVRGEPVPKGQFHLCINVLVRHEDGDILVMRRSASKPLYPGYYEFGAGGSVLAHESSLVAAHRELEEETGLVPDSMELFEKRTEVADQCHFDYYLALVSCDKTSISYQEGETDGHIWLPVSQLSDFIESHPCFRHQKQILRRLIKRWHS